MNLFDEETVTEILTIPIGLPNTEDKLVWADNKSGVYSVKSGYFSNKSPITSTLTTRASSSYHVKPALWKYIWQAKTTPKVKIFLWNACHNALPTLENLYRRNIVPAPICPLCKQEPETVEHTLLLCP